MSARMTLADLKGANLNEAISQIAIKSTCPTIVGPESPPVSIKTAFSLSPSTDEAKLNKTEAGWLAILRANKTLQWIGVQCVTLKLGDDCRYTPDFMAITSEGQLLAYETKGFMRDDARVKLKVASRMYPWIGFVLVTKEKGVFSCSEVKT